MKETRQSVESQLSQLLPKAPSDRVLNSIASQLSSTQRASRWGNAWTWGAVALAVAASVAVAVWWWPRSPKVPGRSSSPPIVERHAPEPAETPPPTMLAYQHALRQSPEELDALLDRQAATLLVRGSPSEDLGSLYQNSML